MIWTQDKPSQDGYYWYHDKITRITSIVHLCIYDSELFEDAEVFFTGNELGYHPDRLDGWWLGPIAFPSVEDILINCK